jgi:ParB family chromosome partitioning protein
MTKKRTQINLAQPIQPRGGELERLFATTGDVEQAAGLQLVAVRLDAIDPDPDQPRSTFNEDGLRELSESIRQDGVIQPIEVTQSTPGRYLIVHGERRWRAAQLAGLETIPAVVRRRDYDEVTRFVRQVVENIQREDLNDIDRAAALLRLRKLMQEELDTARRERGGGGGPTKDEPWAGKVTWSKVGGRLGYSRQRIHQLIQLLDLPEEIRDAVRDGVLSERDTRVYQGLSAVQQRALHRARLSGEMDTGDVRAIGRLLREAPEMTVASAARLLT